MAKTKGFISTIILIIFCQGEYFSLSFVASYVVSFPPSTSMKVKALIWGRHVWRKLKLKLAFEVSGIGCELKGTEMF